jgi:hypothetical protein
VGTTAAGTVIGFDRCFNCPRNAPRQTRPIAPSKPPIISLARWRSSTDSRRFCVSFGRQAQSVPSAAAQCQTMKMISSLPDALLVQLRAAAKARRRRKPPPEPKPRRPLSQTALLLRALKARARQDPQFADNLARTLGVYPPLAREWCAGTRRPSPVRRRQLMKFLANKVPIVCLASTTCR